MSKKPKLTRWRKGPPPARGWWNASCMDRDPRVRRWWNGHQWSLGVLVGESNAEALRCKAIKSAFCVNDIEWRGLASPPKGKA